MSWPRSLRLHQAFLASAVARRVFWVLLGTAALPLAAFAALAYGLIADRLEVAARSRLQDATKYAALQVYDRLVAAQAVLEARARAGQAEVSGASPPALRDQFSALATLDGGAIRGSVDLVALWQTLAGRQAAAPPEEGAARRLWWAAAEGTRPGRVLLALQHGQAWWIAEIAPAYLWGDLNDPQASISTCVADARGVQLMCLPRSDEGDGPRIQVTWNLFTRADFGSIDWVFTRQAARAALAQGELPVEALAWKAALFSVLLVIVASLVLIRRTTVPLERLIHGTRRLAQRDWSARVQVQSGDEFGQLAGSFNQMAGRIERQVQALELHASLDREMLAGLDLDPAVARLASRLRERAGEGSVAVLLAPDPGAGLPHGAMPTPATVAAASTPALWSRRAPQPGPVAMDAALLLALHGGSRLLQGSAARTALPLMGLLASAAETVWAAPARAGGRVRALLLLAGDGADDAELQHDFDEAADRLAVLLIAHEREQALRERALRDSLTGLLNRAGLHELLPARLAAGPLVLAFVDLDGFKAVNDSHGHPVGDALLGRVAAALREGLPAGSVIARPGGDEFVLLLDAGRAQADALAEGLCRRLAEPFVIDGVLLRVGASIGLVRCPEHGSEPVELMRRADLAMYAAKAAGRGRHAWFHPVLDRRAAERAWMQAELPRALREGGLMLHYQPRVAAGDQRLASVEALVRWLHPQRGLIAPAQFVPLAEDTGQIEALGHWVLAEGCRQLRRWLDSGVPVPRLAVNVSALQLAAPEFAERVLMLLREHRLAPRLLELELTESVFAGDADVLNLRLAPLRAAGVQLALDDFGTGFSSLSALHRLPVDVLKIDRAFVQDLGQRESASAVARSIVALARALGKHVVAEGVETVAQQRALQALGCDELQGYLFARPMPAAALEEWLVTATAPA